MKLRTTILLLVLTLGLLGYIVLHERRQPTTRERQALQTHPYSFSPTVADEIEITRKDDTLRLLLRNGGWSIGQPFEDPADPDLVKQLLEAVPALEWLESLERDELRKEDLKRAGLGEAAVKVTIRSKGAPLAQFSIGAAAALEGCAYASLAGDKEHIFIARTKLPSLLAKGSDDWRDPKLVRLKAEEITHFVINAGSGIMEFLREKGQPWRIVKPIQTRGSDERINAVINAFLNLKVKPASIAIPAPTAGPDLPLMTATLEGPNLAHPLVMTFHPNADPTGEVQTQVSSREGVFLASAKVNDFWKLQPNHLRDQNLVAIPKDQISALRIRSQANAEVVLDKQGENWMLKRFGSVEAANQERVTKLIDSLNTAQVRDFLSDAGNNLEPWGLHQPFLSIEWGYPGKMKVLEFGQGTEGILTARVTDEPFIYRVGASLLSSIPPDSLRWKGTKIINESIFSVRRIIVAEGDRPATTLFHNPDDTSWTASIAGRDATAQIEKARANQLLQKLVEFQVSDWNSDRASALQALKNPTLTVQLLLQTPGSTDNARAVTLTFAPLQPGMDTALYHGRKNQDPDTFLISRDLYHELIKPVVK